MTVNPASESESQAKIKILILILILILIPILNLLSTTSVNLQSMRSYLVYTQGTW